jgi:putative sigma-54 modulation protein
MEVEFTARKVRISKVLRTQAEEGLQRIARMLGRAASASVTFSAQKHIQIAEVTIKARQQTIAATGQSDTLASAIRQALAHAENQARRHRDRRMASKRLPKEEKVLTAPPVAMPKARAAQPDGEPGDGATNGRGKTKGRTAIAVHSFPARATVVEPHIVKSSEALALKPLTLEEAVKEVEFRDRDLLVFRSPSGDLCVLHRRRDGHIELLEIP